MRKLSWVLLIVVLVSCDIFDKDETIPGFVYIESADLVTDELTQGANTSSIVDATVYADGEFMGTFELPATVPILENGFTQIEVGAGIKTNGLSSDRRIYPFYSFFKTNIELIPDGVTAITADSSVTFEYFETGLIYRIEDFENLGFDLVPYIDNNATFDQIGAPAENVRSGVQSLEIELTPENPDFTATTNWELYNLPRGNNMYLELDFKGDNYLEVGILAQNPERRIFALGLNPQSEWTKVYIDLTDEISSQFDSYPLELYFESRLNDNEPARTIYIDNLKFIHP